MDEQQSGKGSSVILPVDTSELWKGCMLALCIYAVRLPEYPFILNEHVWKNGLYLTMDHEGARGALAFSEENVPLVGLFSESDSIRPQLVLSDQYAASFFKQASEERQELARAMFPIFEEEVGEQKLPVVTTGFWMEKDEIRAIDSFDDWFDNGGHLLEIQMMPFEEAMEFYEEFYHIDPARLAIVERIYMERTKSPHQEVFLTNREVETIIKKGPLNKGACQTALAGIQVYFEK